MLAILFAFYDLNISKSIVNQDSTLGKFFAGFGELPGLLLAIIAFTIISARIKISNRFLRYFSLFFMGITTTLMYFYFVVILSRVINIPLEIFSNYSLHFWIFFGCITITGIYLFKTKLIKFSTVNYNFAKITCILFSISFSLVQIFKSLWGRVRFSDLATGFSNFTPWYLPQGMTGGHSFPSGHTMFALIVLPLILLVLNKEKWKKVIVITVVVAWGILVPISRVVIGAHYASDVLFSGGFTTMLFLVLYKKYYQ